MKAILFACLVGYVASQQFVWDLLKPSLNAAEVQALLASARAGQDYPNLNAIPDSAVSFDCASKKQPGFYADVSTQCQVFHRCDINGNLTSYLCVNTTVFNQITLVCDYYFNVDCANSPNVENFANSRIYDPSLPPLFDTPTDPNYVPHGQGADQIISAQPAAASVQKSAPRKTAAKSAPKNNANGNGATPLLMSAEDTIVVAKPITDQRLYKGEGDI